MTTRNTTGYQCSQKIFMNLNVELVLLRGEIEGIIILLWTPDVTNRHPLMMIYIHDPP